MTKRILTILITIVLLAEFLSTSISYADAKEQNLIYLSESQSIVVTVSWQQDDVEFKLISPTGEIITKNTTNESTAVVSFEKAVSILIKNAENGQWKIWYDKGSNESISVSVDEYEPGVWITEFKVGEVNNNIIPVSFSTSHEEDVPFEYRVYLMLEGDSSTKRELESGYSTANQPVVLDVSMNGVNTYDRYILNLEVLYIKNGYGYFDFAYSNQFEFINPNTPQGIEDFDVSIFTEQSFANIDWEDYLPYYASNCSVSVFEDDVETPAFFSVFERDTKKCSVGYNPDTKKLRIKLTTRINGVITKPVEKTIMIQEGTDGFYIKLPEQDILNTRQFQLEYFNADNNEIVINLNGKQDVVYVNGDGKKTINLLDDYNFFTIEYTDADGTGWYYEREVFVDRFPPLLKLFENIDGILTDENSFVITGSTDAEAKLTINSMIVETDENGIFSYEIPLTKGENHIKIDATDVVGNITTYTGTIYKDSCSLSGKQIDMSDKDSLLNNVFVGLPPIVVNYFPLWITLMVAIVLSILILMFWKDKEKEESSKTQLSFDNIIKRIRIISLILMFIFIITGCTSYYKVFKLRDKIDNKEFIDIAVHSVKDAYNLLNKSQMYNKIALVSAIGLIITLVIIALCSSIWKRRINKKDNPNADDFIKNDSKIDTSVTEDQNIHNKEKIPKTGSRFCGNCGNEIKENTKFCSNCGTRVE